MNHHADRGGSLIALICKIKTNDVSECGHLQIRHERLHLRTGCRLAGYDFRLAPTSMRSTYSPGPSSKPKPWLLAVVLFFAAMLLYSQAATTRALMPAALGAGDQPGIRRGLVCRGGPPCSCCRPTRPCLAAVEFDDTGSTRIGKYVFDHPFLIPGVTTITLAVVLGFIIAPMVI